MKKGKFIVGVLAVTVLLVGAYSANSGKFFQGKISGNKAPNKPLSIIITTESVGTTEIHEITSFPSVFYWKDGGDPDNGPQKWRNYRWKITEMPSNQIVWKREWHDNDQNVSSNKYATCKGFIKNYPNAWTCTDVEIPDGLLKVGKTYKFSVEAGDGIIGSGYAEKVLKVRSSNGIKISLNGSYKTYKPYSGYKNGINLEWYITSLDKAQPSGITIYKSMTSPVEIKPENILKKLPDGVFNYFDKSVELGQNYYYIAVMGELSNQNEINKTSISDEVSVLVPEFQAKEYTPIKLTYDKGNSIGYVALKWSDPSGPVEGTEYDIYRSTTSPVKIKPENIVGKSFYSSLVKKEWMIDDGINDFPTGKKGDIFYYVVKINAPGAEASKSNELKVVFDVKID